MQVHEAAPSSARTFELRFSEGDDILSGITELAQREHITAGYVTGIGGLAGATLGWGDPEAGGIKTIPVEQKCELVSLVGNIALRDGKPYVHAHGARELLRRQHEGRPLDRRTRCAARRDHGRRDAIRRSSEPTRI